MFFETREEAGELLAAKLEPFKDEDILILVVPRGGMPVAYPCIKKLNCPYDFLIPRKIGAPLQPEFAIGAVAMDGTYMVNEQYVQMFGVSPQYIQREVGKELAEMKERMRKYRGNDEPLQTENKTVIIIDDGIATGYTLMAGIKSLQKHNPKKIILAIPVGPPDTVEIFKQEIDGVICLYSPEEFGAVGAHYRDFHQVSDEELHIYIDKLKENL
ncbi:MAG: phosphoribosyltransferase [Bacillaceae bacterium]